MWQADPLGVGLCWGPTTIFMILKISCQLGDRQTGWSGARNINWGTKCVVIMINWSRCWNWWVMTSVSSVLTTNQQLNLVPFLPSHPPTLPRLLLLVLLMGLKNVKIESIFIGDDKWLIYDWGQALGWASCDGKIGSEVRESSSINMTGEMLFPWQHQHHVRVLS